MRGIIIGLFAVVAVSLIVIVIGIVMDEQKRWAEFVEAHNCKKVGVIAPSTSVGIGIGMNGQVSVVPIGNAGKTGWACDDGVTYWR